MSRYDKEGNLLNYTTEGANGSSRLSTHATELVPGDLFFEGSLAALGNAA